MYPDESVGRLCMSLELGRPFSLPHSQLSRSRAIVHLGCLCKPEEVLQEEIKSGT